MFRRVASKDLDLNGITTMGMVNVAPTDVVDCFGKPSSGDGYKISGEFAFVNEQGEAFVLHDWMATKLYFDSAPPPVEFWSGTAPIDLHVSSADLEIKEFSQWLLMQLRPFADRRIIYL